MASPGEASTARWSLRSRISATHRRGPRRRGVGGLHGAHHRHRRGRRPLVLLDSLDAKVARRSPATGWSCSTAASSRSVEEDREGFLTVHVEAMEAGADCGGGGVVTKVNFTPRVALRSQPVVRRAWIVQAIDRSHGRGRCLDERTFCVGSR